MLLNFSILSPKEVILKGEAESIILPGEEGVFEVQKFHKPILTRLVKGKVIIDGKSLQIKRGVVSVKQNKVVIIVEEK